MNMKTNVIFKNGVNLVCDVVELYGSTSYLYVHNVSEHTYSEFMNEALKNGWSCIYKDNAMHPKAVELSVKNVQIKRFATVTE